MHSHYQHLFDPSKSGKGKPGKAEFVIDTPEFYIVIEDKDDKTDTMFSGYMRLLSGIMCL